MESHLRNICFCDVLTQQLFREIFPVEFGSHSREVSTDNLAQRSAAQRQLVITQPGCWKQWNYN